MEERAEKLRCEICRKEFQRRHELKVHMKSVQHNNEVQRLTEIQEQVATARVTEASERKRKAQLRDRVLPFITQFHETMFTLMESPAPREEAASTTLSESIANHYAASRPRPLIQKRRKCLYRMVKKVVAELYPDAKLEVYGSIPHRLDSETSDIDVSIISKEKQETLLNTISDAIDACESPYLKVIRILTARIPVITLEDSLSKLELDLSIWMLDKLEINQVFSVYLALDPRVRPLLKAIRHWAKKREINDAYNGTINSFALSVMGSAFLMIQKVLPPTVDIDELKQIQASWDVNQNTKELGTLLQEFFQWVIDFDYQTKRISLRYGGVTEKEAEKFTDDTVFVVERPRTPYQNMTRQVSVNSLKLIRYEFHRAVDMLRDGGLLNDIASSKVYDRKKEK